VLSSLHYGEIILYFPNRGIFLGLPDLDLAISLGIVLQKTGQAFVDINGSFSILIIIFICFTVLCQTAFRQR
jgi:hypothetical protein